MDNTSICYLQESDNRRYEGIIFNQQYAENYLKTKVKARYYDLKGTQSLVNYASSIDETGFAKETLEEIFSSQPKLKNWKIGECIAECYLEDEHSTRFHYESSRDAKNSEGNLHGPDIVGFSEIENETVFVFGETKTSSDANSPPSVMLGSHGMGGQLENIKKDDNVKDSQIKWLAFKAYDKPSKDLFKQDFNNAFKTYMRSGKKRLKLVGILIRDTNPNSNDLKSVFEKLIQGMHLKMSLTLSAIYLPLHIDNLTNYLKNEEE